VAHPKGGSSSTVSRSNWNLKMLDFEEGKTRVPRYKTLGARTRPYNKLNPYMMPSPGIKPGPHGWETCSHHCTIPAP